MQRQAPYSFDLSALFSALEDHRAERGMTWRQVAEEIGVATSTIRRVGAGGRMEADGVRAMVAWLSRAPEYFVLAVGGLRVPEPRQRLPQTAGKHRRFSTKSLFEALDHKRQSMGMTWRQVAADIGGQVTPSMLTRLRDGGRVEVQLMVAAIGWLGVSVEDLTHEADR